jgi:arylsulfatase B/arylsulfatase I/J
LAEDVAYLYDIETDPNESTNLFDDSSYSDIAEEFETLKAYWADKVVDATIPDNSNAAEYYEKRGGIGAYTTSDYTPLVVDQIYDYSDAPNLVFVLVDDWGWNDIGYRSTYLSWTTPTIDRLAEEGVKLSRHFSHELCVPTRGALLTGRYSIRLGLLDQDTQQTSVLPLAETTIAQELKSAGYRTYMVGKWDVGYAATQYYPTYRGFDSFYGFFTGQTDYWTKTTTGASEICGESTNDDGDHYLDLQTDAEIVTDDDEISSDYHNAYLFQAKAESFIKDWYDNYSDQPFFLYYAAQLIHTPFEAPERFLERCGSVSEYDDYSESTLQKHCALNVMLDEVVANLTCTLEKYGMSDNTILVIASDNGGQSIGDYGIVGNNYPLRGAKGSYWRGGVSTTALIHSKLLPDDAQGTTYEGNVHITGKTEMNSCFVQRLNIINVTSCLSRWLIMLFLDSVRLAAYLPGSRY